MIMLEATIFILIFIGWCFLLGYTTYLFIEGRFVTASMCSAILILSLAYLMSESAKDNRPCLKRETTMQYNSATKTMMPVTYCVQYGEWEAQ